MIKRFSNYRTIRGEIEANVEFEYIEKQIYKKFDYEEITSIRYDGKLMEILVNEDRVKIGDVVEVLNYNNIIKDISIKDIMIDDIIRQIYEGGDEKQNKDV